MNFREIYDKELKRCTDDGPLERLILDSEYVRGFVYEVCKRVVAEEVKP